MTSSPPVSSPALQYLLSLLFVNQLWFVHTTPSFNPPFWSIGYEFPYYIFFGLIVFLPPKWRLLGGAIAIAVAGPAIAVLLPIWLLGVLAFRLGAKNLDRKFGWLLWIGSLIGLFAYYAVLKKYLTEHISAGHFLIREPFSYAELYVKYDFAILIFCNIVGFGIIGDRFSTALAKHKKYITLAASFTFSIYLYHFPLLILFRELVKNLPQEWQKLAIYYTGVLVTVAVLAPLTEWRKEIIASPLSSFALWFVSANKKAGNGPTEPVIEPRSDAT